MGLKTAHSLRCLRISIYKSGVCKWATKEQRENSFAFMALFQNALFEWNVVHPLAPPPWLNWLKNTALLRYSCTLIQLLTASYSIYRKTMATRCSSKVYGLAACCCRETSPVTWTAYQYWLSMIYMITIFLVKSRWYISSGLA